MQYNHTYIYILEMYLLCKKKKKKSVLKCHPSEKWTLCLGLNFHIQILPLTWNCLIWLMR